jgi:outer membrane receptor for ferrienterochelin and colicins
MRLRPLGLAAFALCTALPALAQNNAAAAPAPAPAASAAPAEKAEALQQLQRVEVSGTPSDEAKRRASTAAKIIIGREEIERFGDSSLGEVLKRLPGVTTGGRPGRGGDIRMRGMGGGYTQILVNGERMSPGFSLDQLPPDQVERIEVMRAPTAEFGARAVAGTINVVLREALAKRLNDWRFGLSSERGLLRPSIGWTRNDKLDDSGGAYNLTVNAQQSDRLDDVNSRTLTRKLLTQTDSLLTTTGQNAEQRSSINLNLRLQWRLGDGDSFSIQPFLVASKSNTDSRFVQVNDPIPSPLPLNYFNRVQTLGESKFSMLRVNSQWQRRLDDSSRLDLRGGVGMAAMDSLSLRQEYVNGSAEPSRVQDDSTRSRDKSWSLNGKYSRQLANEHSLVSGLEGEGTQRDQNRVCLQNGLTCRGQLEFGDDLAAATQRLAAYAQDEWAVGKQWSFYAGLRGETIATHSAAANYSVSNRASVWTPLLHSVWKFDEKSRDQIRASLTRSYRSPNLQDLIAQPTINSQYPCPDALPCGPNQVNYPDRSGNPNLRPELATGIDVAYENYLSKGGILSANLFVRRISDLMRNIITLGSVPYASLPRWVSRPQNIGNATTMGVELEAKFRLDEFIPDAWPVSMRSNLSLFRSKVDGIPGPNNKLDQQPYATTNLGADYRLRSLPMSVGAGINWTPANTVQQTLLTEAHNSRKLVTDAFALWSINQGAQLRVSASNLTPLDYSSGSVITTTEQLITQNSGGRSYTQWQVRLELKV